VWRFGGSAEMQSRVAVRNGDSNGSAQIYSHVTVFARLSPLLTPSSPHSSASCSPVGIAESVARSRSHHVAPVRAKRNPCRRSCAAHAHSPSCDHAVGSDARRRIDDDEQRRRRRRTEWDSGESAWRRDERRIAVCGVRPGRSRSRTSASDTCTSEITVRGRAGDRAHGRMHKRTQWEVGKTTMNE
jgi:hypothetical protein